MVIPNYVDVVKAARARYAHLSGVERAHKVMTYVAWALGVRYEGAWGRLKRSNGELSADCVALKVYTPANEPLYTFDVLGDSEGECRPQWTATKPTGREKNRSRWVAPVMPSDISNPPDPEPEPEPEPLTLEQRVAVFEDKVQELDRAVAVLEGMVQELEHAVAALEDKVLELERAVYNIG